jgi:DHA1 family multidrug resistance protein-like MFS transporter
MNSLIAKSVAPDFRGRAFGISTSFNQIGQALGPLMGGAIGKGLGLKAPFLMASVACLMAVGVMRYIQDHKQTA